MRPRSRLFMIPGCLLLLFSSAAHADLPAGTRPAGPVAGRPGAWILPNGHRITPAGRHTTLGNFPLGLAATPDGRHLLVVNNGEGKQSLQVVETATGMVTQTVPVRTVFNGVVVAPDGTRIFAAGGGANAVLAFTFANGRLAPAPSLPVAGYPTGLALAPDGKTLLVTCNLSRHVALLDTATRAETGRIPTGRFPFGVALTPDGRRAYVTNWGDNTVSVLDIPARELRTTIPVGGLPCAVVVSPDGRRAYVANANTDSISVLDTQTERLIKTISLSPYPAAPYGSIPNGLALSPGGGTLYVTLAGNNTVAAVSTANYRRLTLFPTAWYPTGILCSHDGKTLFVISSKGVGSGPNKNGAYIGHMMNGLLSRISTQPVANGPTLVAQNNGYAPSPPSPLSLKGRGGTDKYSVALSPLPPRSGKTGRGAGGEGERVSTARNGHQGPAVGRLPPAIKHCVLIVRENRTYDQVLGDRRPGNGDPTLTMFGRRVTPNLHALADRFATGDNFYSDGEVSAQGHQWTLGANCSDYVEKTWMAYYSPRGRVRDSPYAPITYPASLSCLEQCLRHGLTCRMYGDDVRIGRNGRPLPALAAAFDPDYRGWDLGYPDVQRAAEWRREFQSGRFPAFTYIWLPNDHTAGTQAGNKTPRALVADNDIATGMIVEAISHSRYWQATAIFLCEDDSQDGRDHVDAHRNVLLVASPWVRTGTVTSHHYSQAGIYATIERLLHLPPMCQYDALADPIADIWRATPDLRPYTTIAARVPTDERNTTQSAMWRESAALDLDDADADRTGLLETILWKAAHPERQERPKR